MYAGITSAGHLTDVSQMSQVWILPAVKHHIVDVLCEDPGRLSVEGPLNMLQISAWPVSAQKQRSTCVLPNTSITLLQVDMTNLASILFLTVTTDLPRCSCRTLNRDEMAFIGHG